MLGVPPREGRYLPLLHPAADEATQAKVAAEASEAPEAQTASNEKATGSE